MPTTYDKHTHCFMHCYQCTEEQLVDVDFAQYPFAVVVSDDRFKALFPGDPNDPDHPTTNLCVMYHGCCYCNHYYVVMPPNVDGTLVTAAASTGCDDCEAQGGYECDPCPIPVPPAKCREGVCVPPLKSAYTMTVSGTGCSFDGVYAVAEKETGISCWWYGPDPDYADELWGMSMPWRAIFELKEDRDCLLIANGPSNACDPRGVYTLTLYAACAHHGCSGGTLVVS